MQAIKKIIFFIQIPLLERDLQRYGISYLRAQGFALEVWDFSALFRPLDQESPTYSPPAGIALKAFQKEEDAAKAIRTTEPSAFVINLIAYRPASLFLYRALADAEAVYGLLEMNATPMHTPADPKSHILRRLLSITPEKLKNYLFGKLPYALLGVSPASVQVCGGRLSVHHGDPVNSGTKTLWSHTPDYDLFLALKNSSEPPLVAGPYIVFLDEYLPYHPDYLYHSGHTNPYKPERYYATLRTFFSQLEEAFQRPVVIAAHPRSEYKEPATYFGGRTVIQGKTAALVKHASLVVTHASTSANFAVLFRKPILLTYMADITRDPHEYAIVRWLARCLHQTPLKIDAPVHLEKTILSHVETEAYERFEDAYIKRKDSGEGFVGNVLADYLSS